MDFLKDSSDFITILSTIITLISILIFIIPKLKETITNVNSYEDKKTISDYVRIYGVIIWSLFLSFIIFFITYTILTTDKKDNDLVNLFIVLAAFLPILIALIIGLTILILNQKYSAEIYIYNKLMNDQYEIYIDKYDNKIKKIEYQNMVSDIKKPTHDFIALLDTFKKEPFKKPKIVSVYNWLSILFIIIWGISLYPTWIINKDLGIVTRIIYIITMVLPMIIVAYRLISIQNGKLKLSEYEIKKHIKKYKRQHKKKNRTKKHVRTFTFLNYEITFNKLKKR
ncbi:hypothetical protein [Mammaliicoccus sciuri]|uniref:hypothetical protein n=1 Tax=Mammaliicoccus sciuri TaxID=1296 RepID=UPI003F5741CB